MAGRPAVGGPAAARGGSRASGVARHLIAALLACCGLSSARRSCRLSAAAGPLAALLIATLVLMRRGRGSPPSVLAAVAARAPAATGRDRWAPGMAPRSERVTGGRVDAGRAWLLTVCLLAGDIEVNPGPSPPENVRLLLQNVQSIRSKLGDLRQSAPELEKYPIVALTETWLNDTVNSSELESALPHHTLLRRDRVGRVGGGVACFIHNDFSPERRETLEPNGAEMLVVEVRTVPAMILAVCYCPPDDMPALTATVSAISELAAAQPSKSVLAVGDFNVPEIAWTPSDAGWAVPTVRRRSRRADELLDGCHLAGLRQYVGQPTRGENVLDLILSSGPAVEAEVGDGTFPSDHREVVCTVRAERAAVPLVTRQTALNYKRADWDGLRTALRLIALGHAGGPSRRRGSRPILRSADSCNQ